MEILALEDEIINLRMVKKDYEIANIRKACEIADKAYSEILKEIKTGVTEKESKFTKTGVYNENKWCR